MLPALQRGGYEYQTQVYVGDRFGGGKHIVDVVARDLRDEKKVLISLKWQQVSGTAEQKVPFEAMCLAEEIRKGQYHKAYLVLGGDGWRLRDFFTGGGLNEHLRYGHLVTILSLEAFIRRANRREL